MASAELKELVELAKDAGLEGTELSNFLRDERTRQREREKEERERQREREKEEREREKAEADAFQREADRRHEIELARLRVEDSVLNRSGQAERNIGSMGLFRCYLLLMKILMTWTHIYIDFRDMQLFKDGLKKGGHQI